MNRTDWIVCARSSRWAAALRMELESQQLPFRLREVRFLSALDDELAEYAHAVVAVEADRGNFADLLRWLSAARDRHPSTRIVALLDRSLADDVVAVCDVLVEAGAEAIAASPRRLAGILALGVQHATLAGNRGQSASLEASVWAALPWQAG
jgi:hypothetical protein